MFPIALNMELPCPRHGWDYHVPLGLAGRVGTAMFLCTVWNRISIHFRRNYMLVKGSQEGKTTAAVWK